MRPHPPAGEGDPARTIPLGLPIPLEWKLSLLTVALLAAGLAGMLVVTYATLRIQTESLVRVRLQDASAEVASTVQSSLAVLGDALREAGREEPVVRALVDPRTPPDTRAVREVLAGLLSRRDPLTVELLDARGRRVAFAGEDPSPEERRWRRLNAAAAHDSLRVGPLFASAGDVRFWTAVPVVHEGRRVGWIAAVRAVGGRGDALRSLRALLGQDVALYTRNAGGRFWSTAPTTNAPPAPAAAPRREETEHGVHHLRPSGRQLAAEAAVPGTPWVVVLETPESWVARRPRAVVRTLALVGLALTALGAALAWLAGRRISRPLVALTAAAESVALDRYEPAVRGAGRDEIGRLAARFDAMARQVAAARRELEGRVADAQRSRAEAELASRAKSDFLAMMSHELRTPLNAIGGYAQILEMGLHGPVTEAQKDALARIGRSQAHLLALINDVLNFARIEAGQVQYAMDDVPLDQVLAEVEAVVAPQVAAFGLTLRVACRAEGTAARADRDKLRQVLLNLLANAIKYTPRGGSITIDCEADERQVRLHVRDTGTGIPPERLAHIFEPFVQGERALNRPDEGVGLGLAISRDLARGMGGELTVESEVGRGSTFTLVLRRSGPDRPADDVSGELAEAAESEVGS